MTRRPRTSTLVLIGLFLGVLALYICVRPVDESTAQPTGNTAPAATNPVPAYTPSPTPTRPTPSRSPSPSRTASPSRSASPS